MSKIPTVPSIERKNMPDNSFNPNKSLSEPPRGDDIVQTEPNWLTEFRQKTPARVFRGRAGVGYQTQTQLELRRDHAAALDAVHAEFDMDRDLGPAFVDRWKLFTIQSEAVSKTQYLMRPDLGRRLSAAGHSEIQRRCPQSVDLQIVIGDGLSAAAVAEQVPQLLPDLVAGATASGFRVGQPFVIRYCRVGILNDIGEFLEPQVVVLLIGERPGLATAESLSAYFAFQPRSGHTDAQRNLISNIHARGVHPQEAVRRILALVEKLKRAGRSGFAIKEGVDPTVFPNHPNDEATSSKITVTG